MKVCHFDEMFAKVGLPTIFPNTKQTLRRLPKSFKSWQSSEISPNLIILPSNILSKSQIAISILATNYTFYILKA